MSEILPISERIKEYKNQQIIDNLTKLSEEYSHFRSIRGDGNCFYRAVMVCYLEQLIDRSQLSELDILFD